MTLAHKTSWIVGFLLGFMCLAARAQVQVLPEFDENLKLNSAVRLGFMAKGDQEGGDPVQLTIGPSILFYLKPIVKLKRINTFDLNDAKSKFLVLEAAFNSISAPNSPDTNRMIVATTSNAPLKAGFRLSDRNRADLDWKSGVFTWRYRNLLTLERTFAIGSHHIIPYLSAEPYYESQYSKWSTTALTVGSLFPLGEHVQLEGYYEHDNNTGKKKNSQTENIGVTLHLYFALGKSQP
jgi:hypothetical protein